MNKLTFKRLILFALPLLGFLTNCEQDQKSSPFPNVQKVSLAAFTNAGNAFEENTRVKLTIYEGESGTTTIAKSYSEGGTEGQEISDAEFTFDERTIDLYLEDGKKYHITQFDVLEGDTGDEIEYELAQEDILIDLASPDADLSITVLLQEYTAKARPGGSVQTTDLPKTTATKQISLTPQYVKGNKYSFKISFKIKNDSGTEEELFIDKNTKNKYHFNVKLKVNNDGKEVLHLKEDNIFNVVEDTDKKTYPFIEITLPNTYEHYMKEGDKFFLAVMDGGDNKKVEDKGYYDVSDELKGGTDDKVMVLLEEHKQTLDDLTSEGGVTTIRNLYTPMNDSDDWAKQLSAGDIKSYNKFDFSTGKKVDPDSPDWDIAFAGTYIIVNGGEKDKDYINIEPERTGNAAAAILSDTTFEKVTNINEEKLKQDTSHEHAISDDQASNKKGWCYYNAGKHLIHPIKGRILVFRTRDEKYVKMQILSFYKDIIDQDEIPAKSHDFNYYTFKYAYINKAETIVEEGKACECKIPEVETPKRPSIQVVGNLIENGGFEQAIEDEWTFCNQSAFEVTDADAHSGEKSLHFHKPIDNCSAKSKKIKLSPGHYRASCYAKGKGMASISIAIAYKIGPKSMGSAMLKKEGEQYYGWQEYTREINVTANDKNTLYGISLKASINDDTWPISVYFDDVALVRLTKVHFTERVQVVNENTTSPIKVALALDYPAAQDTEVTVFLDGNDPGVSTKYRKVTFAKGAREASFIVNVADDKISTGDREYTFTLSSNGKSNIVVDSKDFILRVKDDEKALPEKLVSIPDDNFRAYLKEQLPPAAFPRGGNKMNVNHTSVITRTKLNVSNTLNKRDIHSLEGVQYFTQLTFLCCNSSHLKSLDVSKNLNLSTLYCNSNELTKLNLIHNKKLYNITCSGNPLTSVKVLEYTLGKEKVKKELIKVKQNIPSLMISTYDSSRKVVCKNYNPSNDSCLDTKDLGKQVSKGEPSTTVGVTTKQEPATATKEKERKTFSLTNTSLTATAYKYFKKEEREGVDIHFNDIQTSPLKNPAADITEALKGMTFKFKTATLDTGDNERNTNIINYFFKKLTDTDFITGTFGTFDKATGKGTITITMNGATHDMTVNFTELGNTLSFTGTVNTWEWGNSIFKAFNSLKQACKLVHTKSDPQHAKIWPDVDIKGSITFSSD